MESITKNPVQMKEVEAFRKSLKRGGQAYIPGRGTQG